MGPLLWNLLGVLWLKRDCEPKLKSKALFTVLSASFLCAYLFIQSALSFLMCFVISLSSHLCFLTYSTSFFRDVSAFSHFPSFSPRIKPKFSPEPFWVISVCASCFGFKKKRRPMTWVVLIAHAAALGCRAGNPHWVTCAPKETPALAVPGPPLSCCCECYAALCGCACHCIWHTWVSHVEQEVV